mgnify:FL=1
MAETAVYVGAALGRYGFPNGHPFGPDRLDAFWQEAQRQQVHTRVCVEQPRQADAELIEWFHTPEYVAKVKRLSASGAGFLDAGDTPAFAGCYEAAATVVGTSWEAATRIMAGDIERAFVPIAGLHHGRRDIAGGFCIFNDIGVVIEGLLREFGLSRIAYVDIDAHHGDGVYYDFVREPRVGVADMHEDGRFLFPGTGAAEERGEGSAVGAKLNIPMAPGAGDAEFRSAFSRIETFVRDFAPEFIIMQCGADSVAGDPLAHLAYSPQMHAWAAERLLALAHESAQGRLLATGGGGYNRQNLAQAWSGVLRVLAR